jgi:hypothetical protein
MNSANEYRSNAEDCLRMAKLAPEERDRPLWATMAQSWLRLAEHAERINHELEAEHPAGHGEPEATRATSAAN